MTCPSQPLHSVGHLHPPSAGCFGPGGSLRGWTPFGDKIQCVAFCRSTGHNKRPAFRGTQLVLIVAFSCCSYPAPHLQTSQTSFRSEPHVHCPSVSCQALPRLPSSDTPVIGAARAHTSVAPQASGQKAKSFSPLRQHTCCICAVLSGSPGLPAAGEPSPCPRSELIRETC